MKVLVNPVLPRKQAKFIELPKQADEGPEMVIASVNVHSACKPDDCPSAVNKKVAPKASPSSGTVQEEEILPSTSAVTVHGWWYCGSVPMESASSCLTCSVTVSPGAKPVPVM